MVVLNVVICEVFAGKLTSLIRSYLPPSTLDHLLDLVEALARFQDQDQIVVGDVNSNIQAQKPRSQQVTELLMEFMFVDLRRHLSSASGSDTCNVVLDVARKIVA